MVLVMGKWLFAFFTVVPLVELFLLTWIGGMIGLGPTIALVVVTGIFGAALAKREGLRVLTQWQRDLAEGRVPADGVLGGLLVLIGGVFLVTPGVLTDVLGLTLMVPAARRALGKVIRRKLEASAGGVGGVPVVDFGGGFSPFAAAARPARGDIVDIQGEEIEASLPVLPRDAG